MESDFTIDDMHKLLEEVAAGQELLNEKLDKLFYDVPGYTPDKTIKPVQMNRVKNIRMLLENKARKSA